MNAPTLNPPPKGSTTTARVLMPVWKCELWQIFGTFPHVRWGASRTTCSAPTRELARERAARQFGCAAKMVTVRYLSNR